MQSLIRKTLNYNGPDRGKLMIKAAKISAAIFVLLIALFWRFPAGVKNLGYGAIREIIKIHTIVGTWNMEKMTSDHFFIKFRPEDRAEAELVLRTAELFYRPVVDDYGYVPRSRVPLILYSTREDLNSSFGWDADQSAMGVYWAGAIRILSPAAWLDETGPDRYEQAFISSGPMAHEFTHLMVDYLTGGNYPRWFTEGVAQYQEYKLTGYELNEPAGSIRQPLYTMKELTESFDDLPNQSLAYRQSFYAVRYIVHHHGEAALHQIIAELRQGHDISKAILKVLQLDGQQFEEEWQKWALTRV